MLVPVLFLALAASAAEPPKASSSTVKLVEFFLKTPTADLPPERVPDFIAVDPAGLPKRLHDPFEAKRLELLALKKNVDGKRKPPVRLLNKEPLSSGDCGPPREMGSVGMLRGLGFTEVTEDEEQWLMKETNCNECELRTEFTLELVLTPPPPKSKDKKKALHFFFNANDPIMNLLAAHRAGVQSSGTSFFGIGGGPKCR